MTARTNCATGSAVLAVAVGILDAAGDLPSLHPLFGSLLLAFVLSQFYWHARCSPGVRRSDLQEFSRRLVRTVFLLVYLVIFAQEAVAFLAPVNSGSARPGHLGGYVVCGAAALVTIRLLAALLHRTRAPGGSSVGG